MTRVNLQFILAAVLQIGIGTSPATAGVIFYTSQSSFDAAVSSSTTVDFEGLTASGTHFTQTAPIVVDGVSFNVPTNHIGIAAGDVPSSQVIGAPFNSSLLFSNNSRPVTADITGAGTVFTAVGGVFGNVSAAGRAGTLTLTGTGGVLDTRDIVTGNMGQGEPSTFFGWTVQGDTVVSVTYSLLDGHPHYEAIDDFVYGTAIPGAAVPEPGIFSFLGLGSLGFSVVAYRRKKRTAF